MRDESRFRLSEQFMRAAVLGSDADLAWGACSQHEETGREVTEVPSLKRAAYQFQQLALSRSVELVPKQTMGHSSSAGSVASGLFCALYE